MVRSIEGLKAATDEQLIAEHDAMAKTTFIGTNYYMDELRSRDADRAQAANLELSRSAYRLAVVNGWLAGVSAVTSIAAIIIAIFN
jgi:hypothetical protein